jgi:hypothetical protein
MQARSIAGTARRIDLGIAGTQLMRALNMVGSFVRVGMVEYR